MKNDTLSVEYPTAFLANLSYIAYRLFSILTKEPKCVRKNRFGWAIL